MGYILAAHRCEGGVLVAGRTLKAQGCGKAPTNGVKAAEDKQHAYSPETCSPDIYQQEEMSLSKGMS